MNLPSVPHIPIKDRDPWSQRYASTIREDEHDIRESDLRNARHAYYGMVSYFDSLIGRVLKALDDGGFSDSTYVFVIADHGEMLGERGTWFKFLPYEWSTRVPMIAKGPGVKNGYVENKGVSLVDLLPTFNDIASGRQKIELADNIDGNSLINLLHGDNSGWEDEVFIEFTGEGVYSPALMLRKYGYKYVHCKTDPPMLFNLQDDPNELHNVAGMEEHKDIETKLRKEIEARWDYERLEQDIVKSQKRRLFVQEALLKGEWTGWDHQPFVDATRAYVRGTIDPNTTATKARRRLPFVEEVPQHHPRANK